MPPASESSRSLSSLLFGPPRPGSTMYTAHSRWQQPSKPSVTPSRVQLPWQCPFQPFVESAKQGSSSVPMMQMEESQLDIAPVTRCATTHQLSTPTQPHICLDETRQTHCSHSPRPIIVATKLGFEQMPFCRKQTSRQIP